MFWEPVPNTDSTGVQGVAEVEDITLWLAVHVTVPWVGCDYRGKGNAYKTISYLIEHGCLLCQSSYLQCVPVQRAYKI